MPPRRDVVAVMNIMNRLITAVSHLADSLLAKSFFFPESAIYFSRNSRFRSIYHFLLPLYQQFRTLQTVNQIKSNAIIVRPKIDQGAGQLCLPHIGITKTEKNITKT